MCRATDGMLQRETVSAQLDSHVGKGLENGRVTPSGPNNRALEKENERSVRQGTTSSPPVVATFRQPGLTLMELQGGPTFPGRQGRRLSRPRPRAQGSPALLLPNHPTRGRFLIRIYCLREGKNAFRLNQSNGNWENQFRKKIQAQN